AAAARRAAVTAALVVIVVVALVLVLVAVVILVAMIVVAHLVAAVAVHVAGVRLAAGVIVFIATLVVVVPLIVALGARARGALRPVLEDRAEVDRAAFSERGPARRPRRERPVDARHRAVDAGRLRRRRQRHAVADVRRQLQREAPRGVHVRDE